jgi:hypothetical protein
MRFKRVKGVTEIFLALLGIGMLLVAFYAYELKLDNNATMGNQRKVLALMGGGCLTLVVLWGAGSKQIRAVGRMDGVQRMASGFKQAVEWVNQSSAAEWLSDTGQRVRASRFGRLIGRHPEGWAIGGMLLVTLVSCWYITDGLWVWVSGSRYFDRQADSFLVGSVALLEKPSEQLMNLANPYDYRNRVGLGYLWDVSLYQGKFYLYWGPVPAVLAAAVKLIHPGEVQDQYLLMFFMTGLTAVLAALLHWLRAFFFPKTPAWTVLLLILVGGLSTPVLWLINRPSVYETAIAGGELFLVLGVYAALRGMAARCGNGWLVVAGLAWGASAGCRVNNAFAVIWLAGLTGLYMMIRAKRTLNWVIPAVCMGLPLLAWAAGLGWFNLARFGSVLETGHRYQLTGPAFPADYSQVVSVHYIVPNLYNYIFRPLVYAWGKFPFVFAPTLHEKLWPWFIRLPENYYAAESVAGIFRSSPLFWLVTLPILRPLRAGWNWVNERSMQPTELAHPLLPWAWAMIAGATLCNLASLLVFISSTMRYLADVAPLMTVLTGLCVWWGLGFLGQRPRLRRLLLAAVVVLGLVSVCIGLLVNFNAGNQRFEANNPHLYRAIERFFVGKP